jgi:trimeric autotransporter adhesin
MPRPVVVGGRTVARFEDIPASRLTFPSPDAPPDWFTVPSYNSPIMDPMTGTLGIPWYNLIIFMTSRAAFLAELTNAVNGNTGDINTLQNQVSTLQGQVSNLQTQTNSLTSRMNTAESNISNLQGRMNTAEGNISNLQGRMSTAEAFITDLQGRMSSLEGRVGTIEQRLANAGIP